VTAQVDDDLADDRRDRQRHQGAEYPVQLRPEEQREDTISGLMRRLWPNTCGATTWPSNCCSATSSSTTQTALTGSLNRATKNRRDAAEDRPA